MANVELTVVDGENISLEFGSEGFQGATGSQGAPGLGVPVAGTVDQVLIKKSAADYDTEWGPIRGSMLSGDVQLINANIAANAEISDSKLAVISSANKVLNSATTATAANAPYSIVARDAFGNFVANRIDVEQLGLAGGFLGSDATFTGNLTVGENLNVTGNLIVSGTTTLVQTQDAVVEDQKLILAATATPSDGFANTGGLQLKGTTDKFFLWYLATDSWTSSVNLAVESGKTFRIGNDNVITASGLSPNIKLSASNIPNSIITSSMLAAGVVSNSTIAANAGIQLTKLASGVLPSSITIATSNISAGAITSSTIASGAVVNSNISDNAAIDLSKLAGGALPSGITIGSSNISAGAVVNASIASNAGIALSKLGSGTLPSGIVVSGVSVAFGINSLTDVNTTSPVPTSGQTLRWDGSQWGPAAITLPQQTLTNTLASLSAGSSLNYTVSASNLFMLLSFTANHPVWFRLYSTEAARAADARTAPGGLLPQSGTGFYAELVTTNANQTIVLAPVATVQGVNGLAYARVQNMDSVTRSLVLSLNILNLPAS